MFKVLRSKSLGQHWFVLLAFLIVIGFTGVQALRTVRHLTQGRYQHDEDIHGWMTLGYIGHSYRVSPQVLQKALGLPESPPDTRPLAGIAKTQGRSLEELVVSLQAAITQVRSAHDQGLPIEEWDKP